MVISAMPSPPITFPQGPLFAARPERLDKAKTVAVLGTARTPQWLAPHFDVLEKLSHALSRQGYNIVTGGSEGANKAANLGAHPARSYAVHVSRSGWEGVPNKRPQSRKKLFKNLATVDTGPARSELLNNVSGFVIIAPGGAGSLQELGVAAEALAYSDTPPEKVILLDRAFWDDQLRQIAKAIDYDLAGELLRDKIVAVDVDADNPDAAVNELLGIITGRKPFSVQA